MSENFHDKLFNGIENLYSEKCNNFCPELKTEIKKDLSWMWTDHANLPEPRNAKYLGCNFWSKEALNVLFEMDWETLKPNRRKAKINYQSLLRHEHVYPRVNFIKSIDEFFGNSFTPEDLYKLRENLEKFFCACVVTRDENIRLDNISGEYISICALSPEDCWSRYRNHNEAHKDKPIEVYKCEWEPNGRSWNLVCVSKVEM